MAWICDVCGEPIHYIKLENGKIVPVRCSLEEFKTVKLYFTSEIRYIPTKLVDFPITNSPQDLKTLQSIVPKKTPLDSFVDKAYKTYQIRSLIVTSTLRTFYLHFIRFLSDFYGDNSVHYIDPHEIANTRQFNYLWLTATLLKDCFFRDTSSQSKFKTMSDLVNPSLVIYNLGEIESMYMKNKGDMLMELITSRNSHGKSTWIIHSKSFSDCEEIKTSENLRIHLTVSNYIPKIKLDNSEEDPEIFSSHGTDYGESKKKASRQRGKVSTTNDPYNLM